MLGITDRDSSEVKKFSKRPNTEETDAGCKMRLESVGMAVIANVMGELRTWSEGCWGYG